MSPDVPKQGSASGELERGREAPPSLMLSPDLVAIIREHRGRMSSRQRVSGADALVRRLRRTRPSLSLPTWGRIPLAVASVLVAFALAVVWGRVFNRSASSSWGLEGGRAGLTSSVGALSYVVDGGFVRHGNTLDVDPASEASVRFSDGSGVLLSRGSHVSMRQVESFGARVALFDGTAYVDVLHRAGARWLFDAGPFLITVTGTAFRLAWDASKEELDVRMDRGSVEVSGPLSDAALALRSGQHLTVRVRQRETLIRERDESAPGGSPAPEAAGSAVDSAAEGSALAARDLADEGGASRLASRSPVDADAHLRARLESAKQDVSGLSKQDWPRLLANGDFETIVRQAEHAGVEGCLASARSADLSALADAARYGRHDELARGALLAQRRRFAGGRAARDAAFLLGKLEETDQNPAAAIGWYDRYMREDSKGPYASDALGRKMILVQQLYGDAQARSVAAEYLNRFPDGAYVSRARALTRTP